MLETFVRPFLPGLIHPPVIPPSAVPEETENVFCSLGGSGGQSGSFSYDKFKVVIKEPANSFKESGRESTKVHVENQDDPDQFVEFCRADKVKLSPEKRGGGGSVPATSSYDLSGSFHDFGDRSSGTTQSYKFQYPKDTTCKSPAEPEKGCEA